jgi:hypothetical protein
MALFASGQHTETKLPSNGGNLHHKLSPLGILCSVMPAYGNSICDMQVCKIVEGQRYSKRLNERQITALLKVTCQRPLDRERDIMQVSIVLAPYLCIYSFTLAI